MGYVQLLHLAETYIVTDDYIARNDTERASTSQSFIKVKQTALLCDIYPTGSLRIRFTLRSSNGQFVYAQIYYNGVPVGTLRSTDLTAPQEYSEDFNFTEIKVTDELQVWARVNLVGTTAYVKNFRIFGQGTKFLATPGY